MKLRISIVALTIALLIGGLALTGTASADVIGDCTLTGYTFMGGSYAYTSKDYFLAQPLYYDSDGSNYGGYGWVELTIGDAAVDSAYLVADLLGIGSMSITEPTDETPGILDLYSTTVDVSELYADADLRTSLLSSGDGTYSSSLTLIGDDYTMTSNGTYSIDITDYYNECVAAGLDSIGFIFSTTDNGDGTKWASSSADGTMPYISTEVVGTEVSAVPVPAAVWLLGSGLLGLVGLRRRF